MTARGTDHDPAGNADGEPATRGPAGDAEPSPATHLARLLKRRRQQSRMSRLRASQLSGINVSSIEAWEMGRVAKPPIHDVMRLAYVLSISPKELQHAAFADQPLPEGVDAAVPRGWLLLERVIAVMTWSEQDVATALSTTAERVRDLRDGSARPSELDAVTLGMVLGAYPDGPGGGSEVDVFALLAQMRA